MPSFHLLRCLVAVGGDQGNQVYRDRTQPIVFPELPILQHLHGEEAITEVHVVGQWNTTNDEVLHRLQTIYDADVVKEVFPGTRPRLPVSDPSVPKCTLPIYKPRPTRPDSPDPKMTSLDQFTMAGREVVEAPPLPKEDEPTPDEIAAHAQDDEEAPDDMGLAQMVPGPAGPGIKPGDIPRTIRNEGGRGVQNISTSSTLPDVNAGSSSLRGRKEDKNLA